MADVELIAAEPPDGETAPWEGVRDVLRTRRDPQAGNPSAAKERLAQAIEHYRKALTLDQGHFWSHFQLGQCYLALGQVSMELVAPVILGLVLDHYLGWSPWGVVGGAVLGLCGGRARG